MRAFYYMYIWRPLVIARLLGIRAWRQPTKLSRPAAMAAVLIAIIAFSYSAGNWYGGRNVALANQKAGPATTFAAPAPAHEAVAVISPSPSPAPPTPEPPAPSPEPVAVVAPPPPPTPSPAPKPVVSSSGLYMNTYAYGQCTYYVARRRRVPQTWGNANTWYFRAAANGYAVGYNPQVGAIAQTTAGTYGHVALVEQVVGSQVYVSEMNFNGNWNVVTYRWVAASSFRYIY